MAAIVVAVIAFVAANVIAVAIVAAVVVAAVILSVLSSQKKPSVTTVTQSTLNQSLDPNAFRLTVLGNTVCGNDERYWEVYGSTGFDQIIAAATHKITSWGTFYINGAPVTFSGNAATGTGAVGTFGQPNYQPATTNYAGALSKYNVSKGVSGTNGFGVTVGGGSLYGATGAFTGCADYLLRWTYSQKALPGGIPSRTAQVVEGSPVYDPRRDSTNGGSGAHRANDCSTWEYSPLDSNSIPIGRNNALQMLRYLLGWRIPNQQTSALVLVDGRGVDPSDINFAVFIAAANTCETEGYYTDCALSTGDSHTTNESIIAAGSQGVLLDTAGLWCYYPATNDTASIAVAFDEGDIISGVNWNARASISDQYNQVTGNFIDPSPGSIFQAMPYPNVADATYLAEDNNFPSPFELDFQSVTNAALAQKLARIWLNKSRLTGQFKATFTYKALLAQNYNCVTLSFSPFGWVNKLFRINSMAINPNGGIDLLLNEEDASVYSGGTITTYIPPNTGIAYNPFQAIGISGLTATAITIAGSGISAVDAIAVAWTAVAANVDSVEIQWAKTSTTNFTSSGKLGHDFTAYNLEPVQSGTSYTVQARTWSVDGVPGAWASTTVVVGTGTLIPVGNTQATQNLISAGQATWNQGGGAAIAVAANPTWTDIVVAAVPVAILAGGQWVLNADLLEYDYVLPGTTPAAVARVVVRTQGTGANTQVIAVSSVPLGSTTGTHVISTDTPLFSTFNNPQNIYANPGGATVGLVEVALQIQRGGGTTSFNVDAQANLQALYLK